MIGTFKILGISVPPAQKFWVYAPQLVEPLAGIVRLVAFLSEKDDVAKKAKKILIPFAKWRMRKNNATTFPTEYEKRDLKKTVASRKICYHLKKIVTFQRAEQHFFMVPRQNFEMHRNKINM
uniref:Uncharacterized protein n=1 Tax=Romanomermis culicivorax TaxID=13658 RepID=A0A915HYJ8_ROMCU